MSYRSTTVIVPADSYDLVTLDDLKADLGIIVDTDDDFLTRAIGKASSAAAQYCGRVFPAETVEEVFDLCGKTSDTLLASRTPIVEITSITQGDTVLTAGDDYRYDAKSGIIYRVGGRWSGDDIAVTYAGGFDPIPLDLQGAAIDMVKALQFNRSRDPLLRSENILSGLYAYTLFDPSTAAAGTPQQVSAALDAYRVLAI